MANSEPVIEIDQGLLRGKTGIDCRGDTYFSFQGIPFAKPPIGPLRFKAPQPPEPWDGILDATQESNECFSRHMVFNTIVGSEDCLTLNVYTPELPKNRYGKLKPVMFYIHGGSFTQGSSKSDIYGPEFLLPEDVVVVTTNYRVGVLGFLSLEDSSLGVPGNAGLKDMVMALKWVQNNIKHFMGDPNNVTIFGESAGGAAVHFLMLSPMAKGLFHRAIAQSGSALCIWASGERCAKKLAKSLGFTSDDEKEILKFLQSRPVEQILKAQERNKESYSACQARYYGPVIEKPSNEPAFLSENPIDIIRSGNYNMVPFLTGYTTGEGMLFSIFMQKDRTGLQIVTDFETEIPHNLKLPRGSPLSKEIATKIKKFYYGDEEPSLQNADKFFLLKGDNFFVKGIYDAVKNHVANSTSPIYLYRMSVETNLNLYKRISKTNTPGVCHADDLAYLFKMVFTPEIAPGSIEDISIKRFTKLWATFARYGNPNPPNKDPLIGIEWKPVTPNEFNFLDIGKELLVGVNPDAERMEFWNEIYRIKTVNCKL